MYRLGTGGVPRCLWNCKLNHTVLSLLAETKDGKVCSDLVLTSSNYAHKNTVASILTDHKGICWFGKRNTLHILLQECYQR